MKSPKNVVLALLVLTTFGGAVLAWRQYRELAALRAAGIANDERAALQKQIWDLRKTNRALEDRLAGLRGEEPGADDTASAPRGERPPEGRGPRGGPGGRGGDGGRQGAAMFELSRKPEFQALVLTQQKALIDRTYAALFAKLNLTPEQAERLTTLLSERQTTAFDVMEAARSQGIDPRENPAAYRKLVEDSRNELNTSIKATLGEAGYAQFENYEQTLPQRSMVNELQQRLSYSSTPLTPSQADLLVQTIAQTSPATNRDTGGGGPLPGPFGAGGPGGPGPLGALAGAVLGGGEGVVITDQAVAQSQTFLAPGQVAALQQMQQQQQAQQQIRQLVNDTLGGPPGRGPGGGGAPARPPGK